MGTWSGDNCSYSTFVRIGHKLQEQYTASGLNADWGIKRTVCRSSAHNAILSKFKVILVMLYDKWIQTSLISCMQQGSGKKLCPRNIMFSEEGACHAMESLTATCSHPHVPVRCPLLCAALKVPLWSNFWYPFFYIFLHNRSFLVILPNFNLLLTLQRVFFGPLFPRI